MIDRKNIRSNEKELSRQFSGKNDRSSKSRILEELELTDNIYSKSSSDVRENPNDVGSKMRSQNSRCDFNLWKLPGTVEEANGLNDNIQFLSSTKSSSKDFGYEYGKILIHYQPLKLLNFQRLLRDSTSVATSRWNCKGYNHDFDISESEDPINIIDNDTAIPYRCAIPHKNDYSTAQTVPSIEDREFFRDLLEQSSTARYFNANVLLADHDETSEIIGNVGPSRKRMKKGIDRKSSCTSSIEYIYLRDFEIRTWYTTPYPEEYNRNRMLYICEYCLKYMNSRYVYYRHVLKCTRFRPPGNEVYRDGKISVWEIDGRENVIYCQNLCLLAKLFLNSKTLYYDVEPFVFYVLTEREDDICGTSKFHLVGYFSKEKLNSTDYNLSCILTLPIYQRKGYGHFLMEFSYLLSRREFKWGTPEKPLSDLGLLSYRNYWKIKCAQVLISLKKLLEKSNCSNFGLSLQEISNLTGMIPTDVIFGLEQLKVLARRRNNYDLNSQYAIKIDSWQRIEEICKYWDMKGYCKLDPSKLVWKPMIFGPSCGVNAVGTMIETTTGATRNTIGIDDGQDDFFKKSMSMLVNFMSDDIRDPRSMEMSAWQKIGSRIDMESQKIRPGDDKRTSPGIEDWELCYQEPNFGANGNPGSIRLNWNGNLKQEVPLESEASIQGPQHQNIAVEIGHNYSDGDGDFPFALEEKSDTEEPDTEESDVSDEDSPDNDDSADEDIMDTRSRRLRHLRKSKLQPIRHHLHRRAADYGEEL